MQEAVPHVTETPSPARDEQPTPHGAERTPPASEQGQHTVEQVDGQSHRQTNNTHPALEEQGSQPHKRRRIETGEDQQQQDMEQSGGPGRTVVSKTHGKRRQPGQAAESQQRRGGLTPKYLEARGRPVYWRRLPVGARSPPGGKGCRRRRCWGEEHVWNRRNKPVGLRGWRREAARLEG